MRWRWLTCRVASIPPAWQRAWTAPATARIAPLSTYQVAVDVLPLICQRHAKSLILWLVQEPSVDELTTVHGRLIMIDPKVGPLLLIAGSCMHVCIHMTAVFGCFAHVGIAGPKQPCTCLGLNGNLVSLPSPMSARTTCATPPTLRTTPSPASGRHVWVCAADGAHPQPAALCGVRPAGQAGGRQPGAGGLRDTMLLGCVHRRRACMWYMGSAGTCYLGVCTDAGRA